MTESRLIFYHKHRTSARLRFLKLDTGSVCAFKPLPALSQLIDDSLNIDEDESVVIHPAQLKQDACRQLGLEIDDLKIEGEYHARVDTNEGTVQVYLTEFTGIDPPFKQAEKINAEFIDLPDARNLTDVELELLRMAYEHVMTG